MAAARQPKRLIAAETRSVTTVVALLAIAVFAISGSEIIPAVLNSELDRIERSSVSGFLLNIALIIFAWRRSAQLRQTAVQCDAAESRAHMLAYFDEVTGLHNRRHLRELTEDMCAKRVAPSALILIDLDNFKKVNDLYGHTVGDQVLVKTARRIQQICPAEATCVRLGGDEFAVLLPRASAKPKKVGELAKQLVVELNRPMRIDETVTAIGVSVGAAILSKPCNDHGWLLSRADMAMYEAKRLGRNRYMCFDPAMEAALDQRKRLEAELRRGVEEGEFIPYFQPIIDLATGAVRGFEVLARWQHPTKGLIEPPEFIELAEATGIISDLSFGVMQEALMKARSWPSEYKISVNVSPVQFNDPFLAARVLKVLATTGFPADRLELEIMERSLLQDHETAVSVVASLKDSGISVSVDDFGIAYASLTDLHSLPFDRIKLDRGYMASLLDDGKCDALVHAVSAIGRGLKVPITAEGVETETLRTKLAELGCDDAQGWLFSKALTAREVAAAYLATPGAVEREMGRSAA